MKNNLPLLIALTFGLATCGCEHQDPPPHFVKEWKPEVQMTSYEEVLMFKRGSSALGNENQNRLQMLVSRHTAGTPLYGRVVVNNNVKNSNILNTRILHVKKYLSKMGIDKQNIEVVNKTIGDGSQDSITVAVDQYVIKAPECPGWNQVMGSYTVPVEGELNFACTTARNLAHMVANPKDLVAPKPLVPGDGRYLGDGVDRLRTNKDEKLVIEKVGDAIAG